jgi:hypothetical protein
MDEPKKPHWWSAVHDLSWDKVKTAAVADWDKVSAGASKLQKSVAEQAIAFGHGAQDVYGKTGPWTSEVEAKLKADWEQTHKDAANGWAAVRDAVKHGYESLSSKAP